MAKLGRPTSYRKLFHNKDFIRLSKLGKNITQIALEWEIDRETLYNWSRKHPEFLGTVKKGRTYCEGWYVNLGQLAMLGQAQVNGTKVKVDVGLYVWLTKNMFKWSDRVAVKDPEESSKEDPGKDYTDEELDDM